MLKRRPLHQRERCHGALGVPAKADDFEGLQGMVLERAGHLFEKVREVSGEVVG
jgi:hypothetical protein